MLTGVAYIELLYEVLEGDQPTVFVGRWKDVLLHLNARSCKIKFSLIFLANPFKKKLIG